MGCNSDYCIAIKSFVEALLAKSDSRISWHVGESQDDLSVYVRVQLQGRAETLVIEQGQVEPLDENGKRKITAWITKFL